MHTENEGKSQWKVQTPVTNADSKLWGSVKHKMESDHLLILSDIYTIENCQ